MANFLAGGAPWVNAMAGQFGLLLECVPEFQQGRENGKATRDRDPLMPHHPM